MTWSFRSSSCPTTPSDARGFSSTANTIRHLPCPMSSFTVTRSFKWLKTRLSRQMEKVDRSTYGFSFKVFYWQLWRMVCWVGVGTISLPLFLAGSDPRHWFQIPRLLWPNEDCWEGFDGTGVHLETGTTLKLSWHSQQHGAQSFHSSWTQYGTVLPLNIYLILVYFNIVYNISTT